MPEIIAGLTIGELPPSSALTGAELLEIEQNGHSAKLPLRELRVPGPDGRSAYQVAVEAGFTGTKAEWLLSLKGVPGIPGTTGQSGAPGGVGLQGLSGDKGEQGDPGLSAFEVAVLDGYVGTRSEWLESLRGPKGDPGEQGVRGAKGDPGEPGIAGLVGPAGVFQAQQTTQTLGSGTTRLDGGRTFIIQSIAVSAPARIRLYGSHAQMSTDAARPAGTYPPVSAGCLLEFIATPEILSAVLSPMIVASNVESPRVPYIHCNSQSVDIPADVTFSFITLEP